jgi:RNA 2',3'-cyclic 3'-phosphodiesterase
MSGKMADKRTFIALDISDEARSECSRHIEEMRRQFKDVRVGWERTQKLHITLKFLGPTPDTVLPKIEEGLRRIAAYQPRVYLALSRTGVFPGKARPRILWVGLSDESGGAQNLYSEVDSVCSELEFAGEDRDFRPHITVGRVREPQKATLLAKAHLSRTIEPVEFTVGEIVLYESRLASKGSEYSTLSRFSFRH